MNLGRLPASSDDATVVAFVNRHIARTSLVSAPSLFKERREEMSAVQPRSFEQRITSLEEQMLEMRDLPNRVAKLESQVQTNDVSSPRMRSREEMEEIYRQIIASSPEEGPRLVAVHRKLIARLDAMIADQRRGVKRRARRQV